jgi:hypothetical protein
MASSYDKICASFLKTSEWKDLVAKFREEIAQAGISKYSFERNSFGTNQHDSVHSFLHLKLGERSVKKNMDFFKQFKFPSEDLLQSRYFNHIPEQLFGKEGHPTYFCKKDKLIDGTKKNSSWATFARLQILTDNVDLITEYEFRTQAQFQAMTVSPDFLTDKKRFYERIVITEIRDVVLKYHEKVGPEVIKEALDEVITHAIMES